MESQCPITSVTEHSPLFLSGPIGARPAAGHSQPEAERVERGRRRKSGRARGKLIKVAKYFMRKRLKLM